MYSAGKLWGITLLAVLSVAVGILSISLGSVDVSASHIMKVIFSNDVSGLPESTRAIIWQIRLPRVIMAFIAGGVLAVAGAAFQALLRNPLADPFILGVSGGAAMGGVLAIVSGWAYSGAGVQMFAFAGALMTILFVYFISRVDGQIPKYKMLLAGVVVNSFLSALIMLVLTMASDRELASALFWLMGDLSGSSWTRIYGSLIYVIIGLIILYMMSRELNLLLLGEEQAKELGTDTERVKFIVFIAASLVTGVIVSMTGLIGFVGLIVPHAARLIWGADHRFLFPASLLMGGAFLTVADTTARTVMAPTELPVGVITALVGGPVFVYLMKKRLHE